MINAAVVGLGIGMAHVAGYLQSPAARLVAVADAWSPRLDSIGGTFAQGAMGVLKPLFDPARLADTWIERGVTTYDSAGALAEAIRGGVVPGADPRAPWLVSVCTPDDTHAALAIDLIEAGAHVLLEKPVALTVGEAIAVGRAAADAGRRLAIGYEFRINPAVRELRRLVTDGVLGTPAAFLLYHFRSPFRRDKWRSWIQSRARSGGLLIQETCHWFDLARWIVGDEIEELVCHGSGVVHDDFDYEDIALVQGRFRRGAVLQISHALTGHDFSLVLQVHGTAGTAWLGLKEDAFSSLDAGATGFHAVLSHGVAGGDPREATVSTWGATASEPFNIRDATAVVVDRLQADAAFPAGFEDGLRSLEVALAARDSLDRGRPVRPVYRDE